LKPTHLVPGDSGVVKAEWYQEPKPPLLALPTGWPAGATTDPRHKLFDMNPKTDKLNPST